MIRLKNILNESAALDSDFINYIKDQEGSVKDPNTGLHKSYKDSVGVWTIGYGHTGNVKPGQRWNERQAESALRIDLQDAVSKVNNYVKQKFPTAKIDTHQTKMLTDFAFNLGGLSKFPKFVTAVVKQDWNTAVENYKRFAGGKELTRRNRAFYNIFLKPVLSKAKRTPTSATDAGKKQKSLIIGKTLYPKAGTNYANVRDEDYVNNGIINNLIDTIFFPDPIGVVSHAQTGKDGKLWYYVKLSNGSGYGYVRSDVVKTSNSKYHIVQTGDTLLKIALANGLTLDRIKDLNLMRNDDIKPGQKIWLVPNPA